MGTLIVKLAGIALAIFVGGNRPLRPEHPLGNDVFRRDPLDLLLLARNLMRQAGEDRRVSVGKATGEEAIGLNFGNRCGVGAHAWSFAKRGWVSFSTRPIWRSPANGVARKAVIQARACSTPI